MTKNAEIKARKREAGRTELDRIKADGFVPGIVYGNKKEPVLVSFDKNQTAILEEESEKASILTLSIEGTDKFKNVLVKEIQYDRITDEPIHADLYEVDMKKEIETEVPLNFIGVSIAVKDLNGVLVKNSEAVDVRCLPTDLPEQIDVDLSSLATFDDMIYVKDLAVGKGVEIMNGPDEVIVMVSEPRSDKEMEELSAEVETDVTKVAGVEDKPKEGEGEVKKEETKKEK